MHAMWFTYVIKSKLSIHTAMSWSISFFPNEINYNYVSYVAVGTDPGFL